MAEEVTTRAQGKALAEALTGICISPELTVVVTGYDRTSLRVSLSEEGMGPEVFVIRADGDTNGAPEELAETVLAKV
jgi:hypothetical protein